MLVQYVPALFVMPDILVYPLVADHVLPQQTHATLYLFRTVILQQQFVNKFLNGWCEPDTLWLFMKTLLIFPLCKFVVVLLGPQIHVPSYLPAYFSSLLEKNVIQTRAKVAFVG